MELLKNIVFGIAIMVGGTFSLWSIIWVTRAAAELLGNFLSPEMVGIVLTCIIAGTVIGVVLHFSNKKLK